MEKARLEQTGRSREAIQGYLVSRPGVCLGEEIKGRQKLKMADRRTFNEALFDDWAPAVFKK
ncbi:hypothetical protein Bpfe_026234, partial [Biomphalaria pfeifferi]